MLLVMAPTSNEINKEITAPAISGQITPFITKPIYSRKLLPCHIRVYIKKSKEWEQI